MIPPGARTQISRSIMTMLLPVNIIQRKMSLSSSPLGPLLLLLLGCATKCTATGWSGTAQWDFWTSGGCPGSAQATQTDSSKMSGAGLRTDDRRTCTRSSPDGGTTQYYYENIMFCFSDGSVNEQRLHGVPADTGRPMDHRRDVSADHRWGLQHAHQRRHGAHFQLSVPELRRGLGRPFFAAFCRYERDVRGHRRRRPSSIDDGRPRLGTTKPDVNHTTTKLKTTS